MCQAKGEQLGAENFEREMPMITFSTYCLG